MKKVFATLCILAICSIPLLPSVNAYYPYQYQGNPPPYSPNHPANAPIHRHIERGFERAIRPLSPPQFDEPTNDLQQVLQDLKKQVEKLIEWLKEGNEKVGTIWKDVVFAIAGLLAVVYLIKRRRDKRINMRLKKK